MATNSRPGVFIQEVELPQSIALADNGSAAGAFLGAFAKGSTAVPVLLNSWSQFTKTFGGLDDAYPTTWAAYNFFANGGRQLYVKRIVGTGAGASTLTLQDSAGSPQDTLTINAINAGTWGDDLAVQIVSAGAVDRFAVLVYYKGNLVEKFDDLSMATTDRRYAVSYINATSRYVVTVDEGSTSASPYPSAGSITALDSGDNGAAVVAEDYSFESFDAITNPLVFNVPDAPYLTSGECAAINSLLISYCEGRGDSFAVVDVPPSLSVASAKSFIESVDSTMGLAASYYPWLLIPDTLKAAPGATRLQAPGASMVGQYLATDAARGVFKAPAGYSNRIALAVATEKQLTNTELDTLNTGVAPLNAIRQIPGSGIIVMGARTLNNTTADRYINVRRSIIYIKKELERLSAYAVFENNDALLWAQLRITLGTFLRNYWQNGGLRGASPSQAFYVLCDETTNSAADILNGTVNIEVGVSVEYPAEFIVIKLGQLTGNAQA